MSQADSFTVFTMSRFLGLSNLLVTMPSGRHIMLSGRLATCVLWLCCLFISSWTTPAWSQAAADPANEVATASLIKLPVPITELAKERFLSTLRKIASQPKGAKRATLIIEFQVVEGLKFSDTDFFTAAAIARELSGPGMNGIRTVAYVPNTVKGHSVLPVIACETLVMSPNAELGNVSLDRKANEFKTHLDDYEEIAKQRGFPAILARAFLDPSIEVIQVRTQGGVQYVTAAELAELDKKENVLNKIPLEQRPFIFNGTQGKELGLVAFLAEDQKKLESLLEVVIKDNAKQFGNWKPLLIRLDKPLTASENSQTIERIKRAFNEKTHNFVLLHIDSDGGNSSGSMSLAKELISLDPNQMKTVAWVEKRALADAAWIALACDELMVSPGAIIGGEGNDDIDENQRDFFISRWRADLEQSQKRSWSLGAAMIGYDKPTSLYRNLQTGQQLLLNEDELAKQPDPKAWRMLERVAEAKQQLQLSGQQMLQYKLIDQTVENLHQIKQHYGLENDPTLVEPRWTDKLLKALRNEQVLWTLLVVGIAAIWAELHTPGVGLGGMIALVCFMVFFWAKFLDGTAGWLEAMLFIVGLICLLIEIFIFPGFGVFGFGGGLMMIASLVLASQTFIIPQNSYQLGQLRNTVVGLVVSGVAVIGLIAVIQRFLPKAPGIRGMMLEELSEEERERIAKNESLADYRHLLGRPGVTSTKLTPSGKAIIDDQVVDVVAPGEFIELNTPIIVAEVRGSRVVVKRA
jgi:membrane-bound serine protease (ClpP class)